jgi:dihydroorotate dehydrogenase (NAD+) catalytic subunit
MIELAPHHKIGLNLPNPVLVAAGCCGYGDAYQRLIDMSVFGAVVTQPITLRPRRGIPQPRLVETRAGFILNTGRQNPGVKKIIQRYSKIWSRLPIPVIVHLPAEGPDDLRRTARALSSVQTAQGHPILVGFELGLPHTSLPEDVAPWVRAIQAGTELPLLVKLPLAGSCDIAEIAEAAANASADALVIGTPPLGTAFSPAQEEMVAGYMYGPALHPLALHNLQTIANLVDLPLIAVGGIHSLADAQAFIEAGATAVQLDSLLFIDPKAAYDIASALQSS